MSKYIPTIGIEVHVELKTNTKIFSDSLNGYGMGANCLVNVVDLGYPGVLPTLNGNVVNQAIKACKILNCNIRKKMHFDRKNYFYPDNPKNYQITQARTPIGYDGYVEICVSGKKKKIEIEEMHIEEDTCKSAHRSNVTLLDFNRAGVPLIEIVTKPCISSGEEARLYLEKLKELLLYADISDCKMEEGSMRCDCNVSIRKSLDDPFGTKVEIKNIGSISNVCLSIEKEIERQTALLDDGQSFKEQTRRFDDKIQDTVLMRYKETGNDYRYFPEPDIPYLILSDEMISSAISDIPILPDERRKLYIERGVSSLNADKIINHREISDYLNSFLDTDLDFVVASNLLLGDVSSYLNRKNIKFSDLKISRDDFTLLVSKLKKREITSNNLKDIIDDLLGSDEGLLDIIKRKNISNVTDTSMIKEIVLNVINSNSSVVSEYLSGHDRSFKFLMGQVMKESKGKFDPKIANDVLKSELDSLNK